MKTLFGAAVLVMCFLASLSAASQADIEKLANELRTHPDEAYERFTSEKSHRFLGDRFVELGPPAIPALLALLLDKDESVRKAAGSILFLMPGLEEKHLDPLLAAEKQKPMIVSIAIAKIGTPRAAAFLVDELMTIRDAQSVLGSAVELLGPKAVPHLLAVYQNSGTQWDDALDRTMYTVFHEMGDKADSAIPPLLAMACDETASKASRLRAIQALAAIGHPAARVAPSLEKLAKSTDKEISLECRYAIVAIGVPAAVPILVQSLENVPDEEKVGILSDIAELGPNGVAAGPLMLKYLAGREWETRMAAARVLGYIGYESGTDQLIDALGNQEDWRLVYNAADSLGRLHSQKAEPTLKQVSENHWYPYVRTKALSALQLIRGGGVLKPCDYCGNNFRLEFLSFQSAREETENLDSQDMGALGLSNREADDPPLPAEALQPNNSRQIGSRRVVKVNGGHLVGRDGGEWGGSLTFYGRDGASVIIPENTSEIYPMQGGFLAIATRGYCEYGTLYKVAPDGNTGWRAKKWRELPGAPYFSRILRNGHLFVSCNGGLVSIAPDGTMKWLTKAEALTLLKR